MRCTPRAEQSSARCQEASSQYDAWSRGTTATIRGSEVVLRSDGRTTVLAGHGERVNSVSFSADGTQLVTASRDRDARIWDVATGETRMILRGHFGPVQDARFSPDGRWVVTAGPGRAGLWDARTGGLVTLLRGHRGLLTSAAFSPSGRAIVTGGVDGTVRTYRCDLCGGLDELVRLADRRLGATGRRLTLEERERYLGLARRSESAPADSDRAEHGPKGGRFAAAVSVLSCQAAS